MKKVLVVDDSATMRRMIIASLSTIGDLSFEQAVSGLEAIERITLSSVDLVVLDLNTRRFNNLGWKAILRRYAPQDDPPGWMTRQTSLL